MHKFDPKNLERLDNAIRRQNMPPVEERVSIEEIKALCQKINLPFIGEISINCEHYGVKFNKEVI